MLVYTRPPPGMPGEIPETGPLDLEASPASRLLGGVLTALAISLYVCFW